MAPVSINENLMLLYTIVQTFEAKNIKWDQVGKAFGINGAAARARYDRLKKRIDYGGAGLSGPTPKRISMRKKPETKSGLLSAKKRTMQNESDLEELSKHANRRNVKIRVEEKPTKRTTRGKILEFKEISDTVSLTSSGGDFGSDFYPETGAASERDDDAKVQSDGTQELPKSRRSPKNKSGSARASNKQKLSLFDANTSPVSQAFPKSKTKGDSDDFTETSVSARRFQRSATPSLTPRWGNSPTGSSKQSTTPIHRNRAQIDGKSSVTPKMGTLNQDQQIRKELSAFKPGRTISLPNDASLRTTALSLFPEDNDCVPSPTRAGSFMSSQNSAGGSVQVATPCSQMSDIVESIERDEMEEAEGAEDEDEDDGDNIEMNEDEKEEDEDEDEDDYYFDPQTETPHQSRRSTFASNEMGDVSDAEDDVETQEHDNALATARQIIAPGADNVQRRPFGCSPQ